jgi:hypothetical protein
MCLYQQPGTICVFLPTWCKCDLVCLINQMPSIFHQLGANAIWFLPSTWCHLFFKFQPSAMPSGYVSMIPCGFFCQHGASATYCPPHQPGTIFSCQPRTSVICCFSQPGAMPSVVSINLVPGPSVILLSTRCQLFLPVNLVQVASGLYVAALAKVVWTKDIS